MGDALPNVAPSDRSGITVSSRLTPGYRYSARAKERTGWQKEKDKLQAQLKEVEGEIQAFTQEHEAEINTLMDEYMLLRQQASEYDRDFL